MSEDIDPHGMAHHAARMLENPAWRRVIDDVRRLLDRERDSLPLGDEGRLHVSIAQTVVGRIERHAVTLTQTGKVDQINATNAARRVARRQA